MLVVEFKKEAFSIREEMIEKHLLIPHLLYDPSEIQVLHQTSLTIFLYRLSMAVFIFQTVTSYARAFRINFVAVS